MEQGWRLLFQMGRSGEAFAQHCRAECREMGREPLGTSTLSMESLCVL